VLGPGYRIEAHADPSDEPNIIHWPNSYYEPRGIQLFNTLLTELTHIEQGKESLERIESLES
jgi:hypothetical protein